MYFRILTMTFSPVVCSASRRCKAALSPSIRSDVSAGPKVDTVCLSQLGVEQADLARRMVADRCKPTESRRDSAVFSTSAAAAAADRSVERTRTASTKVAIRLPLGSLLE